MQTLSQPELTDSRRKRPRTGQARGSVPAGGEKRPMTKRSKGKPVLEDLRQTAMKQGFITIDQIENAMDLETNVDLMDEVYIMLGKMKIEVFDSDKDAQEKMRKVQKQEEKKTEAKAVASQVLRYDDPVRMYLREMGRVPLLDREGEVEIAKRIEAGDRQIRVAIFQSPGCLRDLEVVCERLEQGKVKLEDVVQLDFGGWSTGGSARKDTARVQVVVQKGDDDPARARAAPAVVGPQLVPEAAQGDRGCDRQARGAHRSKSWRRCRSIPS